MYLADRLELAGNLFATMPSDCKKIESENVVTNIMLKA